MGPFRCETRSLSPRESHRRPDPRAVRPCRVSFPCTRFRVVRPEPARLSHSSYLRAPLFEKSCALLKRAPRDARALSRCDEATLSGPRRRLRRLRCCRKRPSACSYRKYYRADGVSFVVCQNEREDLATKREVPFRHCTPSIGNQWTRRSHSLRRPRGQYSIESFGTCVRRSVRETQETWV